MTRSTVWQLIAAVAVVVVIAALVGCSGTSGGGDDPVVNAGSVAGQILYFTTDQGLENILVTVNGRTDRTDANGDFLVTEVPAGQNLEVQITLPDWLAMPTDDPILVDVVANQTTTLPQPIRLINADDQPPGPPNP
jgi:hypothetical protein